MWKEFNMIRHSCMLTSAFKMTRLLDRIPLRERSNNCWVAGERTTAMLSYHVDRLLTTQGRDNRPGSPPLLAALKVHLAMLDLVNY